MRVAGLIGASALLVGCTHIVSSPPAGPPRPGASVAAVASWIDAGKPMNPDSFNTGESDGVVTQLGDDVAFRSPRKLGARILDGCMTEQAQGTALSCLVPLRNAPPRPDGIPGEWIGGWVDFDGATITVGGLHGDPGPFMRGRGRELGYGDQLKFGDYQCRSDPTGLYCVNYPHHSAVLLGETLVVFGCTEATHSPYVGRRFTCP